MTKREQKYFERKKFCRRPWKNILAFPLLEIPQFQRPSLNDRFKVPVGVIFPPTPNAYERHYHMSHLDEIAMIPLQLSAPVIRHMDFLVKTNELWHDAVRGLGMPIYFFGGMRDRHPVTMERLDDE